jgi:formylglycine-generating enzyme required for sulfatase activity
VKKQCDIGARRSEQRLIVWTESLRSTFVLWLLPLVLLANEPAPRDLKGGTTSAQPGNPREADLAELATGERIEGTVLTESFGLRTAYGDIKLERSGTARVDFSDPGQQLVRVTTTNSNVLTGFLENPIVTFETSDGIRKNLRSQKLLYVRLGANGGNPPQNPHNTWVRLRNGDRLSGKLLAHSLALITAQGTELLSFEDIDRIQFGANDSALVTVFLSSGQKRQGTLATEDLSFRLDLGATFKLYRGNVEFIGAHMAQVPATETPSVEAFAAADGATDSTNRPGLVWIPPGEFVMGSPTEEIGRDPDEGPQTRVIIAHGFWMGKCEVTQSEYQKVIGMNPSNETGDANRPVERVSWFDAMEYCKKLTQTGEIQGKLPEGYAYRLPTEAEWEYACRAGTTSRFGYGEDKNATQLAAYAWFSRNSDSMTHPVGTRQPNQWGLHDMHGNVWEWCVDRWEDSLPGGTLTNTVRVASGSLRVARGGSWLYEARACRTANRDDYSPWNRCSDIGFRVVLAPTQP